MSDENKKRNPAETKPMLAVVLFVKRNNFKNEYQLSNNKNH